MQTSSNSSIVGDASGSGPGSSAGAGAGAANNAESNSMRPCTTADCQVKKIVGKTQRKCNQFVTAPYVMEKPLYVNGKTAIFQVGGQMAKMGDINKWTGADTHKQPVFCIKPGTHAHVINYVVVDEGSESMEKMKSGNHESMRILIESQRETATTKLLKLINTKRPATRAVAAPATTTTPTPLIVPSTVPTTSTSTSTTPATAATASSAHVTTPQIHPNFSIASVEGAVPFATSPTAAAGSSATTTTTNTTAKPTPTPVKAQAKAPAPSKAIATVNPIVDVDQLQSEIIKLRQDIARLQQHGTRR